MTRRDHRGRFTGGATAQAVHEPGVPLLLAVRKCQRVSRGNRTRAARAWARVLATMATLRRELGLPEYRP